MVDSSLSKWVCVCIHARVLRSGALLSPVSHTKGGISRSIFSLDGGWWLASRHMDRDRVSQVRDRTGQIRQSRTRREKMTSSALRNPVCKRKRAPSPTTFSRGIVLYCIVVSLLLFLGDLPRAHDSGFFSRLFAVSRSRAYRLPPVS